MQKKWQIIAGMILSIGVMLVVSFEATTSLNPAEAFRGHDPVPKVVIGFFAFMLVMGGVSLLFRDKLDDHYCASRRCGFPLVEYVDIFGNPVRCGSCHRWFHDRCYRANGATLLTGCMQTPCPSAEDWLLARNVNANVWTHPRTF